MISIRQILTFCFVNLFDNSMAVAFYERLKCGGRIAWIDRWKGLLIFSVVLGHVLGGAWHFAHGGVRELLHLMFCAIYMFHMPAFAFLAGMMWRDRSDGFASFCGKKFLRLMVPYYVFGLASIIIYAVFSGGVLDAMRGMGTSHYARIGTTAWWQMPLALIHGGGWPGDGFRANSVLWFLPCLFMTEISYFLVTKIFRHSRWELLLVPILVVLCYGMDHYRYFPLPVGLMRVPEFLLYLLLGRWCGMKQAFDWLCERKGAAWFCLVLGSLVYGLIVFYLSEDWVGRGRFVWGAFFRLVACLGIVLSALMALTCRLRLLSLFGLSSMGIMLMHKPPLVMIQHKIHFVSKLFSSDTYWIVLASAVVITVMLMLLCVFVTLFMRKYIPWVLGERRK